MPDAAGTPTAAPDPDRPLRSLSLMVTARCNMACAYCYQNARSGGGMPWPVLRTALDGLLAAGAPGAQIVFSGGEPLLRLAVMRRAVAYCERAAAPGRRPRYAVFTNGLLLDDRAAEFLDEHAFEVQLSFDGVPAAQDRRGRGTHAGLDALLERLRRRHPLLFEDRLRVAVTVTPDTVARLPESLSYFFARGVLDVGAAAATIGWEGWSPDRLRELETLFERIAALCWDHHLRTGETPFLRFGQRRDGARTGGRPRDDLARCGAARGEGVAVDIDGTIVPCLVAAPSVQRPASPLLARQLAELRLGRLRGGGRPDRDHPGADLRRAAAGVRTLGFFRGKQRMRSNLGSCAECPQAHVCVVCPLAMGRRPGASDPDRVPDFLCAYNGTALRAAALFPDQPDPIATVRHLAPLRRAMRRAEAAPADERADRSPA